MRAGKIARYAYGLEATVQYQRMNVQTVAAQTLRQGHLSERLARSGPRSRQRAEGGTEIHARSSSGAVVTVHIHGCKTGFEPVDIQSVIGLRHRAARRHAPFHVLDPTAFASLAVNLDTTGTLVGFIEHQLKLATRSSVAVGRVLVGKDHCVMELEVLHDHHSPALDKGCGRRHRAVERTRSDDPVENAMVVQPPGVRREQLGLEGNLATRGFVPVSQ